MKKLVICLAVCFILFSAIPAQAGRSQAGDAESAYCDCGLHNGVPCYNEITWQRCDDDNGLVMENSKTKTSRQAPLSSGKTRDIDAGSLGLFALVAALLLRRLII